MFNRRATAWIGVCAGMLTIAAQASATDHIYFSATDNVTNVLVQYINAETVRLDISSWYLSEHAISIAIANRFAAGVPVRLIGDRGALFENDPHTKAEFYWLASQGVPIRLRFNPTWFPEINHWKMALFVGQQIVEFGSGNFAPVELAPVSSTNYDDETELFTDDPVLVNAFKTKFDLMWNDTTPEPESLVANPPYLKDWNDACANEPTGNCADYHTLYPNPAPMIISTARLEGDNPMPPDLIWGQGPDFNNRLSQEILNENHRIDLVVYRLEVDSITNALLSKFRAGVPVRILVDPAQYTNITWPEYWLTHANIDKLWAAGVPIRQALHAGVTHMKTLVTSTYATNASSNFGPNWQRDHNYFVSAATKPTIYQAIANRLDTMWNDTAGFGPLQLTPPKPAVLASPVSGAGGVAPNTSLVWNLAAWAVSYDVYLGTTEANLTLVGNVPAQLVVNPPSTYAWTPAAPLQPGTKYVWKVVSRTNATPLAPSMVAASSVWSFTTSGSTRVTALTVAADKAAPQPTGTTITWTATATGGVAPLQYKWWVFDGVTWRVLRDWAPGNTFAWTPGTANAGYLVGAWARSNGAITDAPEAYASTPFAITAGRVTAVTVAADKAAPQKRGTTITWTATATGGIGPLQYEWWVFDGTTWTVVRDWAVANTFAWTPGTANAAYLVGVWARSSGDTVDAPETYASTPFPIQQNVTTVTLAANKIAPQPIGTSITWTATATGGVAPLQYKWWVFDGETWSVLRDWAPGNTFAWTPGTANAGYLVGAWARSNGAITDAPEAYASTPFAITAGRVTAVTVAADKAAPQKRGTTITWTATATGGIGPLQYKWWVFDGTTWTVVRDWAVANTFAWTPGTANAAYLVGVWARSSGDTVDAPETYASVPFRIR